MRLAMLFFSGLCIGLGMAPDVLYVALPYPVDFVPYTATHVVSQLQLLLFSGLAFFLMLGWLKRTLTITIDTDWFWRRLGPAIFALDKSADGSGGGDSYTVSAARLLALACTYQALTAYWPHLADWNRRSGQLPCSGLPRPAYIGGPSEIAAFKRWSDDCSAGAAHYRGKISAGP